ncbi:MAG TPA: DEAD/DEAH box helicase family protein [Verrucomicrobiota bacterium]|nr:DEAD/DEAH box helicase family protein [Verrucomicrobiota bacterium]
MTRETDARMVVDQLLKDAGWNIFDKSQVSTEEPTTDGRADYLLKSTLTRPLAVVEAKRFSKDPYGAKAQALPYAQNLGAPFIILTNGREHYFWDYGEGDARPILGFPSRVDLETRANLKFHRKGTLQESLSALPYPETFFFRGEPVEARPYQLECLRNADEALMAGRRRMLFEMATGTGKTLTIAMLMKRWFQAALISRVLFLADRIELAKQAKETFDDYLKDWPSTLLFGGKRSLEGQIVVGTLDTIASQLGPDGFGHAYFDLVVTDECHRSIYNTHRATLGHFDAVHIGLTATPSPGELRWINEHERQLVRNTYMYFDCWDSAAKRGKPTFTYTIQQGIQDDYLAPYKIYVAQTQLSVEGTTWNDEDIAASDWGRCAESMDRLKLILDEFYRVEGQRYAERPRKTIVFAVSDKQADLLTQLFNRLLPDEWCLDIAARLGISPGQVREGFAEKITTYTNNGDPKPAINRFKYDALPYIAVSVDMLDTGFDHKLVETLVMLRPTDSAMKYAQMRGRGSRICIKIGKTEFWIYDFVGNVARFNDASVDYQKPREVGAGGGVEREGVSEGRGNWTVIPEGAKEDTITKRETIIVGPEGLEIDRRSYRDDWTAKVVELHKTDPVVQKIFAGEPVTEEEWEALARRLNAPRNYFTEASLRKAFVQPTGSLSDFIRVALGAQHFPSREERITQVFDTWVAEHSASLKPEQATMLRLLKQRVLTGDKVELRAFSQPPFSIYGGRARMEQLFGKDGLNQVVEELNALLAA